MCISPKHKTKSAPAVVDGDPETSIDMVDADAWLEIDLGAIQPLVGIHIWNRAAVNNIMLEYGFIFISSQPFQSDDPVEIQRQPGVKAVAITEPPGYPTPYTVGVPGRYVRIVSTTGKQMNIGEVEVFARTE